MHEKITIGINYLKTLSSTHKKKFYFFSLQNIRMSRSSIKFNNEKIRKSDFYKNK